MSNKEQKKPLTAVQQEQDQQTNEQLELTMSLKNNELITDTKAMLEWAENRIESGLLPESITEPEQVLTILQQGKELGLQPITALNNINVIKGKPVLSSTIMGALLKKHGVEWIWEEDFADILDTKGNPTGNKRTTIRFFWISEKLKREMNANFSVTWKQFELAGYTEKDNWQRMPKEI